MLASAEEMASVQAFFQAELIYSTWVGGSDAQEEDVWRTSDGEFMTYLGWAVGEPDGGTSENCRYIYAGVTYDTPCSNHALAFICVM